MDSVRPTVLVVADPVRPASRLSDVIAKIRGDELLKNSFFLLSSTMTQGILGSAFWLLCARLFTAGEVGEATILISACVLLAYISLLGFNSSLIRYLPEAIEPEAQINNGLALCSTVSVLLATGFVFVLPAMAPRLAFVRHSPIDAVGFVAFVTMTTLVLLTDAVFIARRQSKYNLLVDGLIQGTSKLAFPAVLVGAGAFGILAATGIAAGLDVVVSLALMVAVLGYRPRMQLRTGAIREAFKYSSANYFANLLNLVPTLVLPIAVLNELGARAAAYYYVAFSIANMLNAVAYSICQSLFAEGSHEDADRRVLALRAARVLGGLTIPAGGLVAALGPLLLFVFGRQYERHASATLAVFASGLIAVAACSWAITLLRMVGHLRALMFSSGIYAATICGLALWWVRWGLVFGALAWVAGNTAAALVAGGALWRHRKLFL